MWINRFRTALTLLGIIIGVASVVVISPSARAASAR